MQLQILKFPRYFEWAASPARTVIVAGIARSGTTWLGNMVAHLTKARVVFEPCISDDKRQFLIDQNGKFDLSRKYEMPLPLWDKANFEMQKTCIEQMLFATINQGWGNQDFKSGIYFRRVVKMIRANFFIGHISCSWPSVKILYVIRSPHEVIESMLNQNNQGWKFDWASKDILRYADTYPEWMDLISRFDWDRDSLIDRLTLRWCLELKIALGQLQGVEHCMLLQYGKLQRGESWNEISLFLGSCGYASIQEVVQKPSRTFLEKDKRIMHLTTEQIARIHKMAQAFGLESWIE